MVNSVSEFVQPKTCQLERGRKAFDAASLADCYH
jgi:hypothetical protein